jgi:hypothetical protein
MTLKSGGEARWERGCRACEASLSLKCLDVEITCGVCTAKRERSSRHFLCMGYSFTFCKPVSQESITLMQFVGSRPTPL